MSKYVRFAAAAAALLALSACSAGTAAPQGGSLSPVPPAPAESSAQSTPAAPESPTAPSLNARGYLPKQVGESAGLTNPDGSPAVDFKVTSIEVDGECTNEYAMESVNGHFLVISMEVTTGQIDTSAFHFDANPHAWEIIGPDGTTENDSVGNAYHCLADKDSLPALSSGKRAVGKIALDSAHTSGALVLTQPFTDGGWEWSFGLAPAGPPHVRS